MTNELASELKSKILNLISVPHCYKDLKEKGQKYIDAIGSSEELKTGEEFFKELDEDVLSIDSFINFTSTEQAEKLFGKDQISKIHQSALDAKKNGEKYCTCAACQAGKDIFPLRDKVLK